MAETLYEDKLGSDIGRAGEGENREIRVSYDMYGGGSVKPVPGDRERKKGISR
jgi:hypothetical protein